MKKEKDHDQKKPQPEEVETPRPPQVMDPSRLPENEDPTFGEDHPKRGSSQDKKSDKKSKKKIP